MKMNSYFKNKKILTSVESEQGAEHLLHRLRTGELQMDILPNSYKRFSGELEEEDYISYCDFLSSYNGQMVLDMLEEEDDK